MKFFEIISISSRDIYWNVIATLILCISQTLFMPVKEKEQTERKKGENYLLVTKHADLAVEQHRAPYPGSDVYLLIAVLEVGPEFTERAVHARHHELPSGQRPLGAARVQLIDLHLGLDRRFDLVERLGRLTAGQHEIVQRSRMILPRLHRVLRLLVVLLLPVLCSLLGNRRHLERDRSDVLLCVLSLDRFHRRCDDDLARRRGRKADRVLSPPRVWLRIVLVAHHVRQILVVAPRTSRQSALQRDDARRDLLSIRSSRRGEFVVAAHRRPRVRPRRIVRVLLVHVVRRHRDDGRQVALIPLQLRDAAFVRLGRVREALAIGERKVVGAPGGCCRGSFVDSVVDARAKRHAGG